MIAALDGSTLAAVASSVLALAATVFTGLRTNKVEKRSFALQELESSLKYRAEDINHMLTRLKTMEEKVAEMEHKLEEADLEKRRVLQLNNEQLLRITTLEAELAAAQAEAARIRQEIATARQERDALQAIVDHRRATTTEEVHPDDQEARD